MVRIFLSLASFSVGLLTANLFLGLILGDFGEATRRYAEAVSKKKSLSESGSATRADIEAAESTKRDAISRLQLMKERFRPHFWLGVASALVAVLVNCISVTYFIGTSRWCREVVEAYGLEWQLAERSRRLKRWSFPFATLGLLTTVAMAASGAAADPAALQEHATRWVIPHAALAMLGLATITVAFCVQGKAVAANYQVIQEILAETQRIRSQSSSDYYADSVATQVHENT